MNPTPPPKILAGVLYALAAAIGFALSLVTARMSYEHGSDASTVMLVRFVVMLAVLFVWARLRGLALALPLRDIGGSSLCGLLYFSSIFSYLSSVAWLPVSLSVLIFYTYPIVLAILMALVWRRIPSPLTIFALLIAFTGLLLALDIGQVEFSGVGLAFALCASLAMAFNLALSSRLLQRVQTQVFTLYTSVICALMAAAVVLWHGQLQLPNSGTGWWAFGVMLFTFFVGFICTYNAVSRLESLRFASLMNLEPVATIVFALVLLGERLTALQLLGAVVVILGVVMAQFAARSKPMSKG